MVELTLTFIVQAIHFGIAYMLMRYIFLRPALALLAKRECERHALKNRITVARKRVSHQKQIKQEHQTTCQRTFARALSQVQALEHERRGAHAHMTDPAPIIIDQETVQVKRDQAITWLSQEVEHHD